MTSRLIRAGEPSEGFSD